MKTINQLTLVLAATIGICVCVNAESTLSPEQIWKEGVKWTEVLFGIKYEPYRQEAYKISYELRDTSDIRGEKFLNLYKNGRLTNIKIRQHEGKLQFAIHIPPQAGMEDSTYIFDRYDFNTWELGQYAVERALKLQQPFSGILDVFDLISNRLNPDSGWEHTVIPGIYLLRQGGKTKKIIVR